MFLNVQNSSFISWQLEKKLFETSDDRLKVDNREIRKFWKFSLKLRIISKML